MSYKKACTLLLLHIASFFGMNIPVKNSFHLTDLTEKVKNLCLSQEKGVFDDTNPFKGENLGVAQSEFLTFIEKRVHKINFSCVSYLLTMYQERALYLRQTKEERRAFLTQNMLEKIVTFFVNKKKIDTNEAEEFLCTAQDPLFINKLIYKYNFLQFVEKPMIPSMLEKMRFNFFIVDNAYYQNKKCLFYPQFFTFAALDNMCDQSEVSQIKFIKKMIKPRCYQTFKPSEFSGNVKEKIVNFLLCLYCVEKAKIRSQRLPKPIKSLIFNNLVLHEYAQRNEKYLFPKKNQLNNEKDMGVIAITKKYLDRW